MSPNIFFVCDSDSVENEEHQQDDASEEEYAKLKKIYVLFSVVYRI